MTNAFKKLLSFIMYYRETFIWPVTMLAMTYVSIFVVNYITGRPILDDMGSIIGMLLNCPAIVLAMILVGWMEGHLVVDLCKDEWKSGSDIKAAIDTFKTLYLITFFTLIIKSVIS